MICIGEQKILVIYAILGLGKPRGLCVIIYYNIYSMLYIYICLMNSQKNPWLLSLEPVGIRAWLPWPPGDAFEGCLR